MASARLSSPREREPMEDDDDNWRPKHFGAGPPAIAARLATWVFAFLALVAGSAQQGGDAIGLTPGAMMAFLAIALWGVSILCAAVAVLFGRTLWDIGPLLGLFVLPFLYSAITVLF